MCALTFTAWFPSGSLFVFYLAGRWWAWQKWPVQTELWLVGNDPFHWQIYEPSANTHTHQRMSWEWREFEWRVMQKHWRTWRVKSRADAWGIVLYIWPNISLNWDTIGAKSCRRVFTDFSKMAHTAWHQTERKWITPNLSDDDTWRDSYLHHLWIIQPFTENRLNQRKDLLEHHHHLKHTHINICKHLCQADRGAELTGLGPVGGGADLMGGAFSPDSSSCLLMSSVVKRLDNRPKMWIMASLFEGFGWNHKSGSDTFISVCVSS